MKPKERALAELLVRNQMSFQKGSSHRGPFAEASPGRRALVRLVVLGAAIVLAWFFVGEPMLAPLVEAAHRHTATSRISIHEDAIIAAAEEARLEPELVAAIVFAESSGRVDAHSSADAFGLMQLRLPTAVEQAGKLSLPAPTKTDLLTDPALNLRLGANYFRWILDHEEGDVERSLVAYNAGRGRLRGWIKAAGSFAAWRKERENAGKSSTLAYARKVLDQQARFRADGIFLNLPDGADPD